MPLMSTPSTKKTKKQPSASSEQDRELVARALDGDQRAYRDLENKYRDPLARHVGKMVKHKGQVEDLVQEALIKAFNSLKSYSTDYAFSTWVYKIATNHTIDYLRKKKLQTLSIDKPVQTKEGELQMELPDSTWRPDKHIVADQRNTLINAAIAQLPEKYHKVIEMRHVQELSYEEIAVELELPLGTVKAHIFRARALLYKYLKDQRADL